MDVRQKLVATGATALLLLSQGVAEAQLVTEAWGREGLEIQGYAGLLIPDEPAFAAGETPFAFMDNQVLFGGRVGYTTPWNAFIQGDFGYSPLKIRGPAIGGEEDLTVLLYGGSVGYNFQPVRWFQFFILGGAGLVRWDGDSFGENDFRFHFGGGFRGYLTPNLALRVEARDHVVPMALSDLRADRNPTLNLDDELTHNIELSGGITVFLGGGPKDSDQDGVTDRLDACPQTPLEVAVDARGCPRDDDGDGVPNYQDNCANTPAGVPVGARGCPLDGDGDGVHDGADRCPNTPVGTDVDSSGCPLDSDGDGVPDRGDRCPNTPAGTTVDDSGCPVDSDNDGVPDARDRCPNTPPDAEVDETGCTRIEAGLEAGRLVLHNIYFDHDRANIRTESRPVLNELGQALVQRPNFRIEIQGHTDSSGPEAYNQQLSERRAQSVRDYLIANFPNLDPGMFVVQGYGEARPIASNRTAEGRQENRRVEFVVLDRGEE